MSKFFRRDVKCASCNHQFNVELALAIQTNRTLTARQEILDGRFQIFTCERCGHQMLIESSLIYTDFQRRHYVAVETLVGMPVDQALTRHHNVFARTFMNGPPVVREMGAAFTCRLVFGVRALREKLLIWNAGLDDYVVEAIKGDLLSRWGLSPQEAELRVTGIIHGGHIVFGRWDPRPRPVRPDGDATCVPNSRPRDFETVPATAYAARAYNRERIAEDYAWLQKNWLVDISEGPVFAIM